ncbi:MAG: PAC2 family protein [Actinobacteria bacterium]|nr:PAC2 family protein [Actinomycetota bacterium]
MPLFRRLSDDRLDEPVLIVGLEGWIDAGFAAGGALAALLSSISTEVLASFDADELIDYRARRPVVHITDGIDTSINWQTIQLRAGKDRNGKDVCFLVGPEPDMRWQAFAADVVAISLDLGVRLAVGLGGFPAPVPHTRPVRLAATGGSAEIAHRIGFVQGTIEVPAGIGAVLEMGLAAAGITSVGLWARVPHYIATAPFPPASAALVEGLAEITDLAIDSTELRTAADSAIQRVDDLISRSKEHIAMVRQLEERLDSSEGNPLHMRQMPTGDEIASELEKYLRGNDQA